jgi:hypothetical protein
VAGVENPITSWGAIFFDFDNDGHQDLYVNNMWEANTLYHNQGTFPAAEIAAAAGVAASTGASFSSAVADVDSDGDVDLLVNNHGSNVELFINNEGQKRRWIRYRVLGRGHNVFAVGANVNTRVGNFWQLREILAGGNGYLGQNELIVHVGLGDAPVVDEVVVTWPGGSPTRTLTNLPSNEVWTLYPPEHLGDADGDGSVVIGDYLGFTDCYDRPVAPGCEMMDFDGNSMIEMNDFAAFLEVYHDVPADCNTNGILDLQEILLEAGLDQDADGVLDTCQVKLSFTKEELRCQQMIGRAGRIFFQTVLTACQKCLGRQLGGALTLDTDCRGVLTEDAKTDLALRKGANKLDRSLGRACGGVTLEPLGFPGQCPDPDGPPFILENLQQCLRETHRQKAIELLDVEFPLP